MNINHAILHIFDFVGCENIYASEEMDLSNKSAKNYVSRFASKALTSLDNMTGSFSEGSFFAEELRAYFRNERDFVELSRQIGEFIEGEMKYMEKTPSYDLLVVDFEDLGRDLDPNASDEEVEASFDARAGRYFAVMMLESKQAYMHEVGSGESGACIEVARRASILPNPSQKIASYAVVNLRTMEVLVVDKPRTIAGEERMIFPEGLLQCSVKASSKDVVKAVTQIVEQVAEEYGTNVAVATSKAKLYVIESAEDCEEVDLDAMAHEVFPDNDQMADRFSEMAVERSMPERVSVQREAARRVAKSHKIRTDTGIEITFPAEYAKSPEFITFTSNFDGTISIELKNIQHIENR